MLSPVREDTLALHTNQLKWMGYPLVLLLAINLTCVIYAVSRTPTERAMPAHTLAAIATDPTNLSPLVASQTVVQQVEHTPAVSDVNVSKETSQPVEGTGKSVPPPVETETVSAAPMAWQAWPWMPQWPGHLPTGEADGNQENGVLPDDREMNSIVPDIVDDSPEPEMTPKITAQPSSPIHPSTKGGVARREQPGLVVRNPASTGGPVAFLANGIQVTLKPGETTFFGEETQLTIRFHRGGSFGNATYVLSNGQYQFAVTKNGWSLLEDDTSDAQ